MQTIAPEIYPAEYQQLAAIIFAVQQQNKTEVQSLLENVVKNLKNIASTPQRLQMELFIKAIRNRLEHVQAENLYLVPDEGQQIRMFNFMAEKFPVVRVAQSIANSVFLSKLTHSDSFVILDIGIGTGQQMVGLLQRVVEQAPHVKKVVMMGIEPSSNSLAQCKTRLQEFADAHELQLKFMGIQKTVEQLDPSDWKQLEAQIHTEPGPFLINAAFALHHIHPIEFRTALFHRLKSYNPAAFMIIEPYANYLSSDLLTRFQNAWHHYGLTFRAIDMIDADEAEKCAVKEVFFGREMMDVLSEGERVEQFETAEMWTERLVEAGFSLSPIQYMPQQSFNPVVQLESRPSYISFNVNNHPIVAVISAS